MVSQNRLSRVAITTVAGAYPASCPYDPDQAYPEYKGTTIAGVPNKVYAAVRENFRLLGFDRHNFGKHEWNPLGDLIKPGNRVFIKPNWVTHEFRETCPHRGDLYAVITHPAVIRAVADYVALALKGNGEIIIGDNPSIDADFEKLSAATNLSFFETLYPKEGISCRVLDLRPRVTDDLTHYGLKSMTKQQAGDPEGSSVINIGEKSCFYGLNPFLYRGVYTKRWETIKHHHGIIHEYAISNTILNSDVYISIPKLKTHHKVGATLNIKGLVGINANKNYLVHWRIGFPATGGDEFPPPPKKGDYFLLGLRHLLTDLLPEKFFSRLKQLLAGTCFDILLRDTGCLSFEKHRGAWKGNDTCWRMAADLYKAFIKDAGGWRKTRNRTMKTLSIIDGVLAGEGDGPFCPTAKAANVIVAGEDLLFVDCVAARLMDFEPRAIKYIQHLLVGEQISLNDIDIASNDFDGDDFFGRRKRFLQFRPPSGWEHLTIGCGSSV